MTEPDADATILDLEHQPVDADVRSEDDQDLPLSIDEPILTLTEAARISSIPRATLRRRLRAGQMPGAFRDPVGTWLVPVSDLFSVGHQIDRGGSMDGSVGVLRREVARLHTQNAILRERLEAAEVLASERQERIEDLRLALRMLPEVWAQRFRTFLPPGEDGSSTRALHCGEGDGLREELDGDRGRGNEVSAEARPVPGSLVSVYWTDGSGAPGEAETPAWTASERAPEPDPEIQRLQADLARAQAEQERLIKTARRRWWPFGRSSGRHRRRSPETN